MRLEVELLPMGAADEELVFRTDDEEDKSRVEVKLKGVLVANDDDLDWLEDEALVLVEGDDEGIEEEAL